MRCLHFKICCRWNPASASAKHLLGLADCRSTSADINPGFLHLQRWFWTWEENEKEGWGVTAWKRGSGSDVAPLRELPEKTRVLYPHILLQTQQSLAVISAYYGSQLCWFSDELMIYGSTLSSIVLNSISDSCFFDRGDTKSSPKSFLWNIHCDSIKRKKKKSQIVINGWDTVEDKALVNFCWTATSFQQ